MNVKQSKYVPHLLNFTMDGMHVDAINDKHGTTCGVDVSLHRDNIVLDVVHELSKSKYPFLL